MSDHRVDVIRIGEIEKHPNADALGLVRVMGWTCAVRLGDFVAGDLCAFIEPDYVVPPDGPFAFLSKDGKPVRIKAKRLRGTWSQGLLVRAPEGAAEGDDVRERMGVVRYEPEMRGGLSSGGDAERPCGSLGSVPKYDVESWQRHRGLFTEGETVYVTEKIHGANARFAFREGRMWCGSRTQWKRAPEPPSEMNRGEPVSIWWKALAACPWVATWCEAHPDSLLYGEVFGQVQDLKYGARGGEVFFRAFDVLASDGSWLDAGRFVEAMAEDWRVPLVYVGAYSHERLEALAVADSVLAPHLAEGVVIKPAIERTDPKLGRVAVKLVSNRYLERG